MTTDDPILRALAEADPVPAGALRSDGEADERLLSRIVDGTPPPAAESTASPRRRRPRIGTLLAPALALAATAAVVFVVLHASAGRPGRPAGIGPSGTAEVAVRVQPTPRTPRITGAVVDHELASLRAQLAATGRGVAVTARGDRILIAGAGRDPVSRADILRAIESPARLLLVDWEASVLTADGHTVAAGEARRDPAAHTLSQGLGSGPGGARTGIGLYGAVRLASRQHPSTAVATGPGAQLYRFAAPGRHGCRQRQPCYLAGPATGDSVLDRQSPGRGGTVTLRVPRGTEVVQASGQRVGLGDRDARFYVLRDAGVGDPLAAGSARAIRDPTSGSPSVAFELSPAGLRSFRSQTRGVAHRGAQLATGSDPRFQHFAVLVGDRIVIVPQIDYRQFPNGIVTLPRGGVTITGGLTHASAERLAAQLNAAPPPVDLSIVDAEG